MSTTLNFIPQEECPVVPSHSKILPMLCLLQNKNNVTNVNAMKNFAVKPFELLIERISLVCNR